MSTLTPAAEAKARQFADRVIAERAPAGETVEPGATFDAFISACRHVSNLAARKKADLHLPGYERAWWSVVRTHAAQREIAATNRAVAAYDARQVG